MTEQLNIGVIVLLCFFALLFIVSDIDE